MTTRAANVKTNSGIRAPNPPAVVWPRLRTDHAAGPAVAGRMRPGAWRRRAHAILLRPVGARLSGSRVVSRDRRPKGFPESREIAQAVEHAALVPETPGLVELRHRIVPALARPGCIIATHEAKHIPRKPGPGKMGLHVAHDGRVLGQRSLCKVMRRWSAPRLRGGSIEMRL